MDIAFIAPLERALDRMKRILFRPFEVETWIVLGFAAFLSALGEGGGGWNAVLRRSIMRRESEDLGEATGRVLELLRNPIWVVVIVLAVCIVLALVVLFLWISSRAKFIFLDGVIHDRAAIVEPWKRFQRLGDSLFLWRLVFAAICIVLALLLVLPLALVVLSAFRGGWLAARVLALVGLGAVIVALVLAVLFVEMLLGNFVVPVMYRDDLAATAAWGRFVPLLGSHFIRFLLYGLFLFVLTLGVVVAIVVAGCATLCCGFILLAIPYVGSVLVLPVSVTYRAYGPEFLAQFGADWSVFPPPPSPEPVSPPLQEDGPVA
ncbi:MAG: hypothetical protein LAO51_03220 [Acidobacteriia bacterium]|nr:hypothetical protein [Terriglobia bacterium]